MGREGSGGHVLADPAQPATAVGAGIGAGAALMIPRAKDRTRLSIVNI
jgi:hypothetical protein